MSEINRITPNSPQLDPRAHLVALVAVTFCVVSHGKYDFVQLLPYLLYPCFLLLLGNISPLLIAKRLLLLAPFALFAGLFNPWLDETRQVLLPGIVLPGGWVSLATILLRFLICLSSALIVARIVNFTRLCKGAGRLGLPAPLVIVLLFLGRYLELLIDEGARIGRARAARGGKKANWRSAAGVVGNLFTRTLARAERIHGAMRARGFDGKFPEIDKTVLTGIDVAYIVLVCCAGLGWRLLWPLLPMVLRT